MKAIFKKEMKSYFSSPLGYVFIAVFAVVSAFYFFYTNLIGRVADISYVFLNIVNLLVLIIPILTMRVYSEEKNKRTDQLLLTSPISVSSIVLGKMFSAFAVFGIALLETLIYPLILSIYADVSWAFVFVNYLGFFLLGASFIAVGVFVSSLTENVLISAVSTFGLLFSINLMNVLSNALPNKFLAAVADSFALTTRFDDFSVGIINIEHVIYYISVIAIFATLTVFQIEKRRWIK